ncbi:MAG: hypothetical protein GX063_02750 [Firmicutes bacterium]|nr:hypothetical protein [Bacillota bacterium]
MGPTVLDRVITVNAISSMVTVMILLLAFLRADYGFIDVAIVFALCGFVGVIWTLRMLTPGEWHVTVPELEELGGEGGEAAAHD